VLTEANLEDQALPLLETARAHFIAGHGVRSTSVANVDMNLAVIYMSRDGRVAADPDKALAMLEEALATDEQLLGPEHSAVADILFNVAVARNTKADRRGALAAMTRAAAIYGAKAPGSDRHRTALAMQASFATDGGDYENALAATATALAFPTAPESPQTLALTQLQRARALLALHRAAEARPLLAAARAAYGTLEMRARVDEIDQLLRQAR